MPDRYRDDAIVPWRQKPYQSIRVAGELLNVSQAKIYTLHKQGLLEFVTLVGKTQVVTEGITKLLEASDPWVRQPRANLAQATLAQKRKEAKVPAADIQVAE